jgi:hypothetical protein
MSAFIARERLIYLERWSDEVMPCAPTLQAWADWLGKGPRASGADWTEGPEELIADGATFEASTLDVGDDLQARFEGGAWRHDAPPPGANFFAQRYGAHGWDVETASDDLACCLNPFAEVLDATDEPAAEGDELTIAVGRNGPAVIVQFQRTPEGPRCIVLQPN